MGSTVRRSPGAAVGAARVTVEEEDHDTDEETNEGGTMYGMYIYTMYSRKWNTVTLS